MTKEEVMFVIQFACAIIQVVCLIYVTVCNIQIKIYKKRINKVVNEIKKPVKAKKQKYRFYLCQWLALHCRKPVVIVYGRRRSGKSFTALQLVKKEFKKKEQEYCCSVRKFKYGKVFA